MDGDEDWNAFLDDHPIFKNGKSGLSSKDEISLELSLNTLPDFTSDDIHAEGPAPSGRRQVMVIKDSDLILAMGSEIRMASLADAKLGHSNTTSRKSYKVRVFPPALCSLLIECLYECMIYLAGASHAKCWI